LKTLQEKLELLRELNEHQTKRVEESIKGNVTCDQEEEDLEKIIHEQEYLTKAVEEMEANIEEQKQNQNLEKPRKIPKVRTNSEKPESNAVEGGKKKKRTTTTTKKVIQTIIGSSSESDDGVLPGANKPPSSNLRKLMVTY
jgi:hypothetical protein